MFFEPESSSSAWNNYLSLSLFNIHGANTSSFLFPCPAPHPQSKVGMERVGDYKTMFQCQRNSWSWKMAKPSFPFPVCHHHRFLNWFTSPRLLPGFLVDLVFEVWWIPFPFFWKYTDLAIDQLSSNIALPSCQKFVDTRENSLVCRGFGVREGVGWGSSG